MRTVRMVGTIALLLSTASGARAESGACFASAEVVEVFAGAPGCPDAQYVMLGIPSQRPYWYGDPIGLAIQDSCGAYSQSLPSFPAPDAGVEYYLVGTAEAEAAFGVQLDRVDAGVKIDPWGGAIWSWCTGLWFMSPGFTWPAGMALRRDASGALVFGAPAPMNSRGELGHFGGCLGDAGQGDAASASWPPPRPVCSVVEPPPAPTGVVDAGSGQGTGGAPGDADAPKSSVRDARPPSVSPPPQLAPPPSASTPSTALPTSGAPRADASTTPGNKGSATEPPHRHSNEGCTVARSRPSENTPGWCVMLGALLAGGLRRGRR